MSWRSHVAPPGHDEQVNPTTSDREPDAVTLDLMAFLAAAPSPYHAVAEAADRLIRAGFEELDESQSWRESRAGSWFARRGGALVAWVDPEGLGPEAPLRFSLPAVGARKF